MEGTSVVTLSWNDLDDRDGLVGRIHPKMVVGKNKLSPLLERANESIVETFPLLLLQIVSTPVISNLCRLCYRRHGKEAKDTYAQYNSLAHGSSSSR
mmetsp:Transcript_3241/g.7579  ORF Transcript_3241/g.7579 Transcript_3241/m.7579 type:complete len:97 (+) Transcript_3241:70-360(+)